MNRTELEMVNSVLAAAGFAPLSSGSTAHPLYSKALAKLNYVSGQVQKMALWYNTTVREFTPVAGEIIFPSTVIAIDMQCRTLDYVQKGTKLYNKKTGTTDEFGTEPLEIQITEEWALTEVPLTVQFYIMERTRYEFYLDEDGTQPKLGELKAAATVAWVEVYKEHLRSRDTNYFAGNNTFLKRNPGGRRYRNDPYE